MARLLLGVSGGIAAYKALELLRLAIKAGHSVRVIQTEASTRFVGPASFAGISGAPVLLTEKDAVKLRRAARPNWWVLPVTARLDPAFGDWLLERLNEWRRSKAA